MATVKERRSYVGKGGSGGDNSKVKSTCSIQMDTLPG
jgi:hypothetical protein